MLCVQYLDFQSSESPYAKIFKYVRHQDSPPPSTVDHQINGMITKPWTPVVQTRCMELPYISIFWNLKNSFIQEKDTAYLTLKLSKREKRTVQLMFFDPSSIFTIWNWKEEDSQRTSYA